MALNNTGAMSSGSGQAGKLIPMESNPYAVSVIVLWETDIWVQQRGFQHF